MQNTIYTLAPLTPHQLKSLRHRILGELTITELDHHARRTLLALLGQIDQRLAAQTFHPRGPR